MNKKGLYSPLNPFHNLSNRKVLQNYLMQINEYLFIDGTLFCLSVGGSILDTAHLINSSMVHRNICQIIFNEINHLFLLSFSQYASRSAAQRWWTVGRVLRPLNRKTLPKLVFTAELSLKFPSHSRARWERQRVTISLISETLLTARQGPKIWTAW